MRRLDGGDEHCGPRNHEDNKRNKEIGRKLFGKERKRRGANWPVEPSLLKIKN